MDFHSAKSCPSPQELHETACWIRDELDPVIAREGPDAMLSDDVLALHELFVDLRACTPSVSALRYSRIHTAILEVAGKATRWPSRLIDQCDAIVEAWENIYGPLSEIKPQLYGPGGRLWRVCLQEDMTRESLLNRWRDEVPELFSNHPSMKHGDLNFAPGSWWINGMFAFREGIIDQRATDGGIVANKLGAYALVIKGSDEIEQGTPYSFTYRCKARDPGKFRLTAADLKSRTPIRVLRSHFSSSMWAPRAGIRYEGRYRVTGWAVKPCEPSQNTGESILFLVKLQREENQPSMEEVMKHPTAEEADDFKEYKRLRKAQRELMRERAIAAGLCEASHSSPGSAERTSKRAIRPCLRRENSYKDGMPVLRTNNGRSMPLHMKLDSLPSFRQSRVAAPRSPPLDMPGGFPFVFDPNSPLPSPRPQAFDGAGELENENKTSEHGLTSEDGRSEATVDSLEYLNGSLKLNTYRTLWKL